MQEAGKSRLDGRHTSNTASKGNNLCLRECDRGGLVQTGSKGEDGRVNNVQNRKEKKQ